MQARVLAAFKKANLGVDNKHRVTETEGKQYLVIHAEDNYQLFNQRGFLSLFVDKISSTDNAHYSIISMEDAKLIAEYLTKNPAAWNEFENFVNLLTKIINNSSYVCEEYFSNKTRVYKFTTDTALAMLQAIVPKAIVLSCNDKTLEIDLLRFMNLSKKEIANTFDDCEKLLISTVKESITVKNFMVMLPPFNEPSTRINNVICIKPDAIQRTFMKPVLELLQANYQTDHILIDCKQLFLSECQKELGNRFNIMNQYATNITNYFRTMITLAGVQLTQEESECAINFTNSVNKEVIINAHHLARINIRINENAIKIKYDDIINITPKQIKLMEQHLAKQPQLMFLKGEKLEAAVLKAIIADDLECFIALVSKNKSLINKPIELNQWKGYTLVTVAAVNESKQILSHLIQNNTSVSEPMETGHHAGLTPLVCAILAKKISSVELLATVEDINKPLPKAPYKGRRPIFFAVAAGDDDMVRFLLSIKADGFSPSSEPSALTPLESAIIHLRPQIVRTLLDAGASPLGSGQYRDLSKLAVKAALEAGKKAIGDSIVAILHNEFTRMDHILKTAEELFLPNSSSNPYRWCAANGECLLAIPTEEQYWQFAISFLDALNIRVSCHTHHDGPASLRISKHSAIVLTEYLISRPSAWKNFKAVLLNIIKAQNSLLGKRALNVVIDKIKIESTNPDNILCPELTALCTPTRDYSMFTLTFKSIMNLNDIECKKLVSALIRITLANNERKVTIRKFYELLFSICNNLKCIMTDSSVTIQDTNLKKLALLGDTLKVLNAVKTDNGHQIDFDEIIKNNWEDSLKTAALNAKKLDAFIALSARFGSRSKSYQETSVAFTYASASDAENFRSIVPFINENISCNYRDIFALDIEALTIKINQFFAEATQRELKESRLKLIKQTLLRFEISENTWADEATLSKSPIKLAFQKIIRSLENDILTIHPDSSELMIHTEKLSHIEKDEFIKLIALINKYADNLAGILNLLQLVTSAWEYTDSGIKFNFVNQTLRNYFERTCETLGASLDETNTGIISYDNLLQISTDDLKTSRRALFNTIHVTDKPKAKSIDDDKPIKLSRPPKSNNVSSSKKHANAKPAKSSSKKDRTKASNAKQKPSQNEKQPRRQPSCAPQDRPYLYAKEPKVVEVKYFSGADVNYAVADECIRPSETTEAVVERLPITEGSLHDNAIQHELLMLHTVHEWFKNIPADCANYSVNLKILQAITHLCLIRLMNAIDLRQQESQRHIQFSDDADYIAAAIRANLIHHSPDEEEVEAFYQTLHYDGINRILDRILHNEEINPNHKLPFFKYRDTFFVEKNITDYTPKTRKIFANLTEFLYHYEALDAFSIDAVHTVRALQDCIIELGELRSHLRAINGFSDDIYTIIKICRDPRNTSTHQNSNNEELNFDTLSLEDILRLARMARNAWEEWLKASPSLSHAN